MNVIKTKEQIYNFFANFLISQSIYENTLDSKNRKKMVYFLQIHLRQ